MQTWFQSPFLQSLGFAIANSLWQAGLLWLVYASLSHILRVSSATKYRMAVAAQLLSFAWFAITLQFYYTQYSDALHHTALSAGGVQAILAGDGGFSSRLIRYMVRIEQALPYVSAAYLLLILVLAGRWLNSFRYTKSIRAGGLHKMPVDWRLFIQRVAPQLGIRKEVALFLSDKIQTPLTLGFWKPVILVPLASINHLTTAQMEAVLLHELAHIRRYDYLVNILLSIVEIALFFNPFTRLLSKSIHKERENSCDDWVLQFQYSAADYAQALLRIATLQSAPALAMAATGKRKNDLLIRVKRMIGQPESAFNYRRQLLSLLLVTGMLGCMAWFNPATQGKQAAAAPAKNMPRVAIEPMAVKVDNPLFNPVFFLSQPLKTEMQKQIAGAQDEINRVLPAGTAEYLAETLPPIVTTALDKAALALEQQVSILPRQMAGIQQAGKQMEKWLADSLLVLSPFRKEIKTGPGPMQELDRQLRDAQQQMTRSIMERKAIASVDEEKIKNDIRTAMKEIERIDLGELVNSSLRLGLGYLITETAKPRPKTKTNRPAPASRPANPDQENEAEMKLAEEDAGKIMLPEPVLLPVVDELDPKPLIIPALQPVFSRVELDELKALAFLSNILALQQAADPAKEKLLREKILQLRLRLPRKTERPDSNFTEKVFEIRLQ